MLSIVLLLLAAVNLEYEKRVKAVKMCVLHIRGNLPQLYPTKMLMVAL